MVRQLTAIMFADMVGFTALMQEDEERARENRDRQRKVLAARVSERNGEVLQYYGDGTLSVFRSAIDAVDAAIEVQRMLRADPPVDVRIGIHTGDVVRDESGVFGDGVNVAARVQGLSGPGEVLISEKVYDEIKNQPRIRTLSLGSFNLKNVRRPMEVYALTNEGLHVPSNGRLASAAARECRSVAVLPFVNMSADPDNEFFADGVTEEIINALTRVNGLQITARTSTFAFKNRASDIRQIASELGVTTVLEGSVRKAGERVRIAAQLIDARDGYHLFSKVYDRALDDIFETQDEIARTIVRELEEHFAAGERRLATAPGSGGDGRRLSRGHGHDTEAYSEYLRGLFYWNKWSPDGIRKAIAHLERSAELDPSCSLPYSAISFCYVYLAAFGYLTPRVAYPRARTAAEQALELEDDSGESHLAMATVKLFHDWDFDGAYRSFQKALGLTPGSAVVHMIYGLYLRAIGDVDEALEELETAVKLDPFSLPSNTYLAQIHVMRREVDQAEEILRRVLEIDPDFFLGVEALGWLHVRTGELERAVEVWEDLALRKDRPALLAGPRGYAYARLGRGEDAARMEALVQASQEAHPESSHAFDRTVIRLGLGDAEGALEWMERAADQRMGAPVFLKTHWLWDELRDHPRYRELVDRIGIPEAAIVP